MKARISMGTYSRLFSCLFTAELHGRMKILTVLWLVGVYALGIWWFGAFFNWGLHGVTFQDWADITAPRLQFFKTAVQTGQLPLHISDPSTMHGDTLRYLTVPDTLISPQMILLGRFTIQRFNFINVLFLYTLGFAGLLVLRKQLHLSLAAFSFLSLLFNFNGNILAHYSVGHTSWGGYFLFSWFAWLILRFVDGDRSWKWTFGMALLLFIIWLQGSFHQYIWLLLFLVLVGLTIHGAFWAILRTGIFTLLMSSFRILPAILLYGKFEGSFMAGYPTLYSIWDSLVTIANPVANPYYPSGIQAAGAWETTCFVGLVGAFFILYFGAIRTIFDPDSPYIRLLLPISGMVLLSLGRFFVYIRSLPIPLLSGERISTRIFCIGLVFLIVLGAERFQNWLNRVNSQHIVHLGVAAAFMLMITELRMNITVWKLSTVQYIFTPVYYNPEKWFVNNNWNDSIYLWLVFGGLTISLLTILGLGAYAFIFRERRAVQPGFSDTRNLDQ